MYREIPSPPAIAARAECIWIGTAGDIASPKRVLPDGCADIIYTRRSDGADLIVVGPMTVYRDFPQDAHICSVGIRFRPGMWNQLLRVEASDLTDLVVPLEDVFGRRGLDLRRLLDTADEPCTFAELMAQAIPYVDDARSPLQRALGALESSHGLLSLDTVAQNAGLSARQFRRRCLQSTGLTPKLLARILRFRYATHLITSDPGNDAKLAYEYNYSDQSHLIAEFKRFAGRTPRELAPEITRNDEDTGGLQAASHACPPS